MAHKAVVFKREHEMLRVSIKPTNTPYRNYDPTVGGKKKMLMPKILTKRRGRHIHFKQYPEM
jgi:hypothetical protein